MEKQIKKVEINDQLIKKVLSSTKTIAMIGVSFLDKEKENFITKRKPSVIVMKYLQEFGYKVIPVNPSASGKIISNEKVVAKLSDIKEPVDMVNVFRPSIEAPIFAKQTIDIGAKFFWLQFGIDNIEAKNIVELKNITYISNRCVKQEYQKIFLKTNPVFPVLL